MSEMRITYQIALGEGETIAYEVGEDTGIDRAGLDQVLDLIGGAAARRKAMFELPFHEARLFKNRQLLVSQRHERAKADAQADARVALRSQGRRSQVERMPQDINTVAQFDGRILEIEKTIKSDEMRIPYLKAIIAGETPPPLFPELEDEIVMSMAAE